MTAGQLVREARERHGLTQKQLAIRARTSQAAISRIERGLVSPTIEMLEKLLAMVNEELVLDAREFDWGHDRTLSHSSLRRSVDRRLRIVEEFSDFVRALRGGEPFRPRAMLRLLVEHGVDFVVIGGVAGAAHGSAYMTGDLDVVCASAPTNLEQLASALEALEALPQPDAGHRSFETRLGPLDILDRPPGSPSYEELKRRAGKPADVDGVPVYVASLDDVIGMKEATGVPRGQLTASELRMLADEIRKLEAD